MKSVSEVFSFGAGRIVGSAYLLVRHPIRFTGNHFTGIAKDIKDGFVDGYQSLDKPHVAKKVRMEPVPPQETVTT